jgi:phage terminase Nu1 subunit (DNA packaging protein)
MSGSVVRLPRTGLRLVSKKQLAAELGRSTRWVELRMREGLPVAPRRTPHEHARFDLEAVGSWLASREPETSLPLADRVRRLEQEVARLATRSTEESS